MPVGNRGLPTPVAEGGAPQEWHNRYGARQVLPLFAKNYGPAELGRYFIARSPTPGTGLATATAPTTLDDTKPFLFLPNGGSPTDQNAKRMLLDYIKLQATAAGTNGTNLNAAFKLDSNATSRYTSGGSALTPKNTNMDSGEASVAGSIYAGAVVAAAASSGARLLGSQLVRPVIPVVGDTYLFNFGPVDPQLSSMAPAGTAIASLVFPHAPVIIGPAQALLMHLFLAAQSAASSYEIEVGWWEL